MEWHYFTPEQDSVRALEHLPITEGTELTVIVYPCGVSGNEPIRMEVNCTWGGSSSQSLPKRRSRALMKQWILLRSMQRPSRTANLRVLT